MVVMCIIVDVKTTKMLNKNGSKNQHWGKMVKIYQQKMVQKIGMFPNAKTCEQI